jgi:hypothetical protein
MTAAAPTLRPGSKITLCGALALSLLVSLPALAQAPKPTPPHQQRLQRRGPPPPPPPAPLAAADEEQKNAALMTHLGPYECEFNEKVNVDKNPKFEGYIDVQHRKALWTMKPVLSKTGALRLEDVKGRMLMLQIANKSMLMDVKIGQRLVDNCVHEMQREAMRKPPSGESIGIDPVKAAVAAAAATAASAAAAASAASAASAPN